MVTLLSYLATNPSIWTTTKNRTYFAKIYKYMGIKTNKF